MSDFDPTGVKPYIPKKGNKDAVTAAPACAGDDCDISLDAAPVSGTSAATSGKDFPLPGILQFITELVDESGKPVPKEEMLGLHNKVVGLYFSAQWCPPCRQFAPMLAEYVKGHSKDMAIVYVSNDHDQRQFNRNIAGKPFYSIPYTDLKTRQMLSTALQVASIPTLAITEPGTGLVVSFQGREQIFYHKRNKQPDPLEGWIGLGAEGNLLEQAKEKEEKAKAEAAGGSSKL